jgi:hypothetical protein
MSYDDTPALTADRAARVVAIHSAIAAQHAADRKSPRTPTEQVLALLNGAAYIAPEDLTKIITRLSCLIHDQRESFTSTEAVVNALDEAADAMEAVELLDEVDE